MAFVAHAPAAARSVWKGRLAAAAIVVSYFLLLIGIGGHSHWGRLGVPPKSPTFLDLRSLTTGWVCTRRGIDVLPVNPCDPGRRPANYPHIWMAPSVLGLGPSSTVTLGFLVAAVFLAAALFVLPGRGGIVDGIVYGLALCSPAVMLGIERGNVDLLVFAVVVASVLVLRRGDKGLYWSAGLLLFAAILKLFPIFAVALLDRRRSRTALLAIGVVLAAFTAYALATLDNIRTIARVVPQIDFYSYGIIQFGHWLSGHVSMLSANVWDIALVLCLLVAAVGLRRSLRRQFPSHDSDAGAARDLDLFWAGASIYVATYALFRSFDYRLVFLLLTVPQLLRWARERRVLAGVTLALVLGALWLPGRWNRGIPVVSWAVGRWWWYTGHLEAVVAAQALLFVGLVAALVGTAPLGLLRVGLRTQTFNGWRRSAP